MIDFPQSTVVHRRLPKEAFYEHLPLTKPLKNKFVSDVGRIIVENSMTKDNLNLSTESEIKEIMLLSITLKKQEFDGKIVETIARQNPHKLVFLLIYENKCQLDIYHGKLYRTEWVESDELNLALRGNTIDAIWDSLIEQIALYEEQAGPTKELTIDERISRQDRIKRLKTLIEKTEAAAWKEQQPKKQFELYQRLRAYKKELEEITNG